MASKMPSNADSGRRIDAVRHNDKWKNIPAEALPYDKALVPAGRIESRILLIRGHKVMLSPDLAALYAVEPRVPAHALKRNIERFPKDFMSQLTRAKFAGLKSQIVTLGWGGARRAPPYAWPSAGALPGA